MVNDYKALKRYPYSGHCALMGKKEIKWQDVDYILKLFSSRRKTAQKQYGDFVEKGIAQGRRPELVGGGLIRSVGGGGWKIAKIILKGQQRLKGNERILGDSDFVNNVLSECKEQYERKYRLRAKGLNVWHLAEYAGSLFNVVPHQVLSAVRYPDIVQARSVLCFWAVRELGITATELAKQMGLTQPAVSISVKRGEQLVKEKGMDLESAALNL